MHLKIAMLFFAAVIVGSVHAQATGSGKVIETRVTEQAMPRNGMPAFYKYLDDSIQFPQRCLELELPGLIQLRFVVDTGGRISQIKPIYENSLCPEYTAQSIRLLLASQPWIPGQKNGEVVNSYRNLLIRICISEDYEE
jgi:protein TonB